MGLIFLIFLLPLCVVIVVRRRCRRINAIVPLVLAIYSIGNALWSMVGLIHSLASLASIDPEMKATLLAKGISEFLSSTTIALILHVPLLVVAWLIDRMLRGRTTHVGPAM